MSGKATTNGEYYDHQRQTWVVQCGATAVPIRKQDKDGNPIPPPAPVKSE